MKCSIIFWMGHVMLTFCVIFSILKFHCIVMQVGDTSFDMPEANVLIQVCCHSFLLYSDMMPATVRTLHKVILQESPWYKLYIGVLRNTTFREFTLMEATTSLPVWRSCILKLCAFCLFGEDLKGKMLSMDWHLNVKHVHF